MHEGQGYISHRLRLYEPERERVQVLGYLKGTSTPRMPYGGPYWSDAAMQLFQDWINGGYQP